MKKLLLLFTIPCIALADVNTDNYSLKLNELSQKNTQLQTRVNKQQKEITYITVKLNQQKKVDTELRSKQERTEKALLQLQDKLNLIQQDTAKQYQAHQQSQQKVQTDVAQIETQLASSNQSLATLGTDLKQDLNQNQLYTLIGFGTTGILLILLAGYFIARIKRNKQDAVSLIENTRKKLEQETIQLDTKLIELLENKFTVSQYQPETKAAEPDHSLALKVADEIVRIQKNISQMDQGTKGLKQLTASIKRIQANFLANGYELVDMLGQEYNNGMKVIAEFIPSDDIETGKQIITRIIKPQVNFNGIMIQSAQIEVSVGE
ncbi:hypothetical protein [Lonepinella sp. BR2357]|uniref:hypothetical protein n=1 Tax=Lonepinella sp. BR2357 TaxID=3434549 RepID=UPI003F6E2723